MDISLEASAIEAVDEDPVESIQEEEESQEMSLPIMSSSTTLEITGPSRSQSREGAEGGEGATEEDSQYKGKSPPVTILNPLSVDEEGNASITLKYKSSSSGSNKR